MDKLILKSKLNDKQQKVIINLASSDIHNDWIYYDDSEIEENVKSTPEARGRKYLILNDIEDIELQSVLSEIQKDLFKLNNLDKSKFKLIHTREPGLYPTILSCIYHVDGLPNHGVHTHKDWRGPNDEMQVRFNYLVSKPEDGGEPVINRRIIDLEEKESMILFASEWLHRGMPIKGKKMRTLLSIGYLVENEYAQELEKRFNYGRI